MSETVGRKLTEAEKARIERNRVKAQSLRSAKVVTRYAKHKSVEFSLSLSLHSFISLFHVLSCRSDASDSVIKVHGTRFKDSGGGFLIEENSTTAAEPEK